MQKIYAIGDCSIDIVFKNDFSLESSIGGSALNTSVSLARLGLKVSLVSVIGKDRLADIIKTFLLRNNISLDNLGVDYDSKSNLALAFLDEDNNAEYSFYKSKFKTQSFLYPKEIQEGDIILFGSSFSLKEETREDLILFLKCAKQQKALIIYDPNYRSSSSSFLETSIAMIRENMSLADIIKGSEDDFYNIFKTRDINKVYSFISKYSQAEIIFTTGERGINIINEKYKIHKKAKPINCVSTIGAGDTVSAALLYCLVDNGVKSVSGCDYVFYDDFLSLALLMSQEVCMSYDNYISEQLAISIKTS